MRKTTMLCLLMLVGSLTAFSQSQPQWKIVHSLILIRQTVPVQETTIFKPSEAGVYRLSAYWSETGKGSNQQFTLSWTDITGSAQELSMSGVGPSRSSPFVFIPKIGTPITYVGSGSTGVYNVALTIEQLQSGD
jgi:hypothetical protein